MTALREMYDGYHFSRQSPDVYNPYSLVLSLQNRDLSNWWFGSGTPTVLVDALEHFDFDVTSLEGFQAQAVDFDAPTEQMTSPVPLLYQSGYLTIKGYLVPYETSGKRLVKVDVNYSSADRGDRCLSPVT